MPSSVLRNVEFFSDYTDLEDVVFGSSGGSEFLCETPTQIHQPKVKNQTKTERERESTYLCKKMTIQSGAIGVCGIEGLIHLHIQTLLYVKWSREPFVINLTSLSHVLIAQIHLDKSSEKS